MYNLIFEKSALESLNKLEPHAKEDGKRRPLIRHDSQKLARLIMSI
ncbi:hypothetical protein J4205_03415 [Candidatus Pacearchaeota archaeon]|nr:hypothetical protein [Candidatus Pacearchaeota archaeon]